MQAPLKTVQKARQDQGKCSKCGSLLPVGCSYRYYKPEFRTKTKIRVCLKAECTPRRSELETSKLADAYAAIEDAEQAVADATSIEDVQTALEECSSRIQDLQGEYEESVEANAMLQDSVGETIERLASLVDDLDSVELEEETPVPDCPEKPDRNDFGDGENDEYNEAMGEYQDAVADYEKEMSAYQEDCDKALASAKEAATDVLSGAEF